MHARLRLDLGGRELLAGGIALLAPSRCAERARRVEQRFSSAGDAFAALSARSGFDLYLAALALPPGSEVLVSGLTIPHMVQILEAHGLVVVPFALDPATLAPAPGELERRAGPRTRAVLFAHLFGARADLAPSIELAHRRGWLFWEDCAQAFGFDGWRGHAGVDLALFSFGLIKTATAVQGGILCVRDRAVLARMRALHQAWSVTPRSDFARRLARTALLSVLGRPAIFTCFARALESRGRDLDEVLHTFTRGFPGPDFLERLRRAPGGPLLWLLDERLAHPERSLWGARRAWGRELLEAVAEVEVFGRRALDHQFWVFAVGTDEPARLVHALRTAGLDATSRSSLVPVEPTGGGEPARGARELLARLVYVPLALDSRPSERAALADILRGSVRPFVLEPRAPLRQPGGYTSGPSGPSGQPPAIHTMSRAIHTTPKATE